MRKLAVALLAILAIFFIAAMVGRGLRVIVNDRAYVIRLEIVK